jgi:peptide-methionine (S)-S-oxide reductase
VGLFTSDKKQMVDPDRALPGRDEAMEVTAPHLALGTPIAPPFPAGTEQAIFGMGCFWGAERLFWSLPGVYTTAVGYAGGLTPNPTYYEVCSGRTGHAEVVLVVYDPTVITYETLLSTFFEGHDPTQGMRQGNDVGTQYRSAIYTTTPRQAEIAAKVAARFGESLKKAHLGEVTTEITKAGPFYYAEPYHQQYLEANPNGYCGLGGTGVSCPVGLPDVGLSDVG